YKHASQKSSSELGKKLLRSLAEEEDYHRKKFDELYNELRIKKAWPKSDVQTDGGSNLRTVFANALDKPANTNASKSELDAVQLAIDMEEKTLGFYRSNGATAKYDAEKEFYDTLASQEREHRLILIDYYEYLKNPAGWYTSKEHHSLDGG
ncbi:hypothetical protein ACFLVP_04205, partial [Chloroflexota bacterium]